MNNVNEIWRDIEGFEGLYQVSNLGNVKSLGNNKNKKEKILKPSKNIWGYLQVWLIKDGRRYAKTVHRLVAEAFIPNPDNLPEINHKSEDKTDNSVKNLEWCTHEYNMNYGNRNKKIAKKLSKPVICIETGIFFSSTMDAERKTGINSGNISNCCLGRQKHAGGYSWKYATAEDILRNGLQYADKEVFLYA